VIIYAGAIMVLFIFVVMLLNLGERAANEEKRLLTASMGVGPAILSAVLIAEFVYILSAEPHGNFPAPVGPEQVATALYAPYLIGVELASMLLLAGIVGAYHLGFRKVRKGDS
jgi:NADH-quinone oxidoreductase subunit J